jgi:two-component system cell cycle sensor histidine kinase/response regulator CckA
MPCWRSSTSPLAREVLDAHRLESLGVLAGGIAHDFNNLLTVVLGGTDLVLRTLAGSPAIEPLIQVRQAALHAGELAHQMLAYTGLASSSPRPLDLGALVREVEALIAAAAGTTPVSLDLPDTGRWVSGDATQLRQVVLNLVINAAEATAGRAGSIALSVRSDGASVVLAVADSGVGMDAATQERIFEPYYSTKFVGRGLGLAVVQGIVRGHKGTLTVESEIGRGTTMRVHLPGMRPAEETRRTESIARWRRSGTVLLVDDDRPVRTAIERILVELGFEVLVAGDGVEAIEIFRTEGERVDLVLMDHAMPRMNGPTAAAAIHGVRAEVPIVLVTGYAEVPADAGGVFSGMLSKPFDIAALEQLLARFST